MDMIQLIVECTMDEEREQFINSLATVKYRLPMIDSYVIELPQSEVKYLTGLKGIKAVHQTAKITAQMHMARKAVNADKVQNAGISGRGISIAILDTGVSPVDDLVKPRNRIIAFKDMINGQTDPYDDNGHGTQKGNSR